MNKPTAREGEPTLAPAAPSSTAPITSSFAGDALQALGWMIAGVGSAYAAYAWNPGRGLIVVYVFSLLQVARQERWRLSFYPGLLTGVGLGMIHLNFFYTLFGKAAIGLWFVFGLWIGLFALLSRLALRRFGNKWGLLLIPFVWTGLEYFRSELYPLRFSWVTPGFAFAVQPWTPALHGLGVFGTGFLIVALVCIAMAFRSKYVRLLALAAVAGTLTVLPGATEIRVSPGEKSVRIAGIQMEFPDEKEVLIRLRELKHKHPETELIVLSEYTFDGPVPTKVRDWCAANKMYLIAGGKEPAPGRNFYNTAYVIGPEGEIVFRQVKAVPIQFMRDGLPATEQKLWESPWGKLGICICYDLSYTRVTDELVRLGAEALIVPTMDVVDWGRNQHLLHARVAPVRAAEYGIPIFRVASSGVSQAVDPLGRTRASAPFPGDGAMLKAEMRFGGGGRLPLDRWLGPASVGMTACLVCYLLVCQAAKFRRTARQSNFDPAPEQHSG